MKRVLLGILFGILFVSGLFASGLDDLKKQVDSVYECQLVKIIKNANNVIEYDGDKVVMMFAVKGNNLYRVYSRSDGKGGEEYAAFPFGAYQGKQDGMKVYTGSKYGDIYVKINKGWFSDEMKIFIPVDYRGTYYMFECEEK